MMTRHIPILQLLTVSAIVLFGVASAFAASPTLSMIVPRGVQRGGEHVLSFSGARLADAEEILFYDEGFEVVKIEPSGANRIHVTVKVDPNCRLGEHVAQVRTASGISDYRTLFVGDLPAVAEKEPNNEFAKPQPLDLNVTVNGIITNEDVDHFVVEAKKGQRLSVEVEGMQLGTAFFDPYIAIYDSKQVELSSADDTALLLQDCALSILVPEDGKYVIGLRDSSYTGSNNTHYRLHVGNFPRPVGVYPAGGKPGESIELQFIGDPTGELSQRIELPSEPLEDFGVFAQDDRGIAPSPLPFRLFEHGNAFEREPNDSTGAATAVDFPLAFNGIIQTPGDIDFFKFTAKKNETYEIECYARRLRSPLDPVMYLYDAKGSQLTSNDDSRGPDSYFRFRIPADGEYLLRVHDHLLGGGPDFVYRVEFSPVKPLLTLGIPRVARYSQYRQTIYVPRGNRFATVVSASRQNFSGDLVLEGDDFPQGVTMVAQLMPSNQNTMPVVFEAADDAPIAGRLIEFTARHAELEKNIRGKFVNRADFIIANPGQSLYRYKDVDKLAIAVVDKLPFMLEIIEPKVPLVRNGSMQLKIVAHREEGFKAPITVEFPYRPPGLSAASRVTIPEGKSEVLYPLNASGNAQILKSGVFAIGSAEVNGSAWVASQLATLQIADQHVTFAMERTSCDQGQETELFCKLNHAAPFEGEAKAQLLGLPNKVTADDVTFNKDTQEFVFHVKTDPSSPVGRHKSVFCQVTITHHDEPIVSRAGTVEIQINKPLPAKPAPSPAASQVVKAAAPQPAAKPLTRLEKLRLDAEEAKKRLEAIKQDSTADGK